MVPHCVVARVGQSIVVGNEDKLAHNPHHYALKNPAWGSLIAPSEKRSTPAQFRKAEPLPVKVTCDFHPWMSGYWLIVNHPYAALTDKAGKFSIDNLPVGDHHFGMWHERVGYVERKYNVTVAAGEPIELPVMRLNITRLQEPSDSK